MAQDLYPKELLLPVVVSKRTALSILPYRRGLPFTNLEVDSKHAPGLVLGLNAHAKRKLS